MNKNLRKLLVLAVTIGLILILINSYFGWYGYKKWNYRIDTRGNKEESIRRGIYVRDVFFEVVPADLDVHFNAFIERGYSFGYHSNKDTRVGIQTNFPFQVSFPQSDTISKFSYSLFKSTTLDSAGTHCVYLRDSYLPDTIYVTVGDYDNNRVTNLGLIKIYERLAGGM